MKFAVTALSMYSDPHQAMFTQMLHCTSQISDKETLENPDVKQILVMVASV